MNQTILSVAQMREADAYTIAKGTPSAELMRRAAQGIFDAYDGWKDGRTLVICGSGNNGGDGYALAEILAAHGFGVEILRVSEKFSDDGKYYYGRCLEADITIYSVDNGPADLVAYNVLVDCMLGTGFAGVPREPVAGMIRRVNEAKEKGVFVVSADINSGMNGDTGEAELAVKSDLTVSIGYLKTGFFRGRAKELIGKLVNVEIGIMLPEKRKVAVIAGTKVDTQMGVDYLRAKDPSLEPYYYNVSPNPEMQHAFQYGDMETKRKILTEIFEDAESKGIRDFFIYCNSLSAAFDFEAFGKERGVNVVTPIMVYRELAPLYHDVAVIAANPLSAYNIETKMMERNPPINVTGLSVGDFVRKIEAGMPPEEMMTYYDFPGLVSFVERTGSECIILGCTHFPYFKEPMEKLTRLPLIDPADEMHRMLIEME